MFFGKFGVILLFAECLLENNPVFTGLKNKHLIRSDHCELSIPSVGSGSSEDKIELKHKKKKENLILELL